MQGKEPPAQVGSMFAASWQMTWGRIGRKFALAVVQGKRACWRNCRWTTTVAGPDRICLCADTALCAADTVGALHLPGSICKHRSDRSARAPAVVAPVWQV